MDAWLKLVIVCVLNPDSRKSNTIMIKFYIESSISSTYNCYLQVFGRAHFASSPNSVDAVRQGSRWPGAVVVLFDEPTINHHPQRSTREHRETKAMSDALPRRKCVKYLLSQAFLFLACHICCWSLIVQFSGCEELSVKVSVSH